MYRPLLAAILAAFLLPLAAPASAEATQSGWIFYLATGATPDAGRLRTESPTAPNDTVVEKRAAAPSTQHRWPHGAFPGPFNFTGNASAVVWIDVPPSTAPTGLPGGAPGSFYLRFRVDLGDESAQETVTIEESGEQRVEANITFEDGFAVNETAFLNLTTTFFGLRTTERRQVAYLVNSTEHPSQLFLEGIPPGAEPRPRPPPANETGSQTGANETENETGNRTQPQQQPSPPNASQEPETGGGGQETTAQQPGERRFTSREREEKGEKGLLPGFGSGLLVVAVAAAVALAALRRRS